MIKTLLKSRTSFAWSIDKYWDELTVTRELLWKNGGRKNETRCSMKRGGDDSKQGFQVLFFIQLCFWRLQWVNLVYLNYSGARPSFPPNFSLCFRDAIRGKTREAPFSLFCQLRRDNEKKEKKGKVGVFSGWDRLATFY